MTIAEKNEQELYPFRREDNDEMIRLPFDYVLKQDSAGGVDLEDGSRARRVFCDGGTDGFSDPRTDTVAGPGRPPGPIDSDAMGFTEHQFEEFEADRQRHGFRGVEFIQDPDVPQFYKVRCSSRAAWDRYREHRGFTDHNRTKGATISEEALRHAEDRMKQMYPQPPPIRREAHMEVAGSP